MRREKLRVVLLVSCFLFKPTTPTTLEGCCENIYIYEGGTHSHKTFSPLYLLLPHPSLICSYLFFSKIMNFFVGLLNGTRTDPPTDKPLSNTQPLRPANPSCPPTGPLLLFYCFVMSLADMVSIFKISILKWSRLGDSSLNRVLLFP